MEQQKLKSRDFRVMLQQELIDRCRKNPRYSLRAFAKALDVSSSALTEMLSGKRKITKRSMDKFGVNLGLSADEIQVFQNQTYKGAKNSNQQKADYHQITLDQYALISDWYHYAILELIKIENFCPDNSWIAHVLGITKSEANIAIDRLIRLGLLEQEEGTLKDTSSGFSTNISENLTSSGSKRLQKQILEQSIYALENIPLKLRNHSSMTMAIDPKLIPEAIQKITKFRRELCEFLESQGQASEVYQLSISIFPISKVNENSNKGRIE